jgi:hypothetical protein
MPHLAILASQRITKLLVKQSIYNLTFIYKILKISN